MNRYLETSWLAPLITAGTAVLAFASVGLRLFPLPHYLGYVLWVVAAANVAVLAYQVWKKRLSVVPKTALFSLGAFALCWLWFIQTA